MALHRRPTIYRLLVLGSGLGAIFCLGKISPSRAAMPLSENPAQLRIAAMDYALRGDPRNALDLYDSAAEAAQKYYGPNSSFLFDINYEAGVVALEQDQFNKAETYLRRAVKLNPYSAMAKIKLAELYDKRQRPNDAKNLIEDAIDLNQSSLVSRHKMVAWITNNSRDPVEKAMAVQESLSIGNIRNKLSGQDSNVPGLPVSNNLGKKSSNIPQPLPAQSDQASSLKASLMRMRNLKDPKKIAEEKKAEEARKLEEARKAKEAEAKNQAEMKRQAELVARQIETAREQAREQERKRQAAKAKKTPPKKQEPKEAVESKTKPAESQVVPSAPVYAPVPVIMPQQLAQPARPKPKPVFVPPPPSVPIGMPVFPGVVQAPVQQVAKPKPKSKPKPKAVEEKSVDEKPVDEKPAAMPSNAEDPSFILDWGGVSQTKKTGRGR